MDRDEIARLMDDGAPAIQASAEPVGAASGGRATRHYWRGALFLVGIAAVFVAWQSSREPILAGGTASQSSPGADVVVPTSSPTGSTAPPASAEPAATGAADPTGDAAVTGRLRLVKLPTIRDNPSPAGIVATNAIDAAVTRALRALPYFEVVEILEAQVEAEDIVISPREVPAGFAFRVSDSDRDHAIARHFGGELAVRVHGLGLNEGAPPDAWYVTVRSAGPAGGRTAMVRNFPHAEFREGYEAAGERLARLVAAELLPDQERAIWESVITDARAAEAVRLAALETWMRPGRGLSGAATTAAIDLARTSTDPAIRSAIWKSLGLAANPAALPPLLDALLYDSDAEVRGVAAEALASFLSNPTARAVLEGVANADASADVRLRARWALKSINERRSYVHATLLDSSLSVDSRVAPLILFRERYNDPGDVGFLGQLDSDVLEFLESEALDSADPKVRMAALRELGQSTAPEFLPSLLDFARRDADDAVRTQAISALRAHRERATNPTVDEYVETYLEALEQDPDPQVRAEALVGLEFELEDPATPNEEIADRLRAAYVSESDYLVRIYIEVVLRPLDEPE